MTKTGRRDENIDFSRNLTKLVNFGICGKFFDEICTTGERKMAFLAAKSGGDLEKALSHNFNHVTVHCVSEKNVTLFYLL